MWNNCALDNLNFTGSMILNKLFSSYFRQQFFRVEQNVKPMLGSNPQPTDTLSDCPMQSNMSFYIERNMHHRDIHVQKQSFSLFISRGSHMMEVSLNKYLPSLANFSSRAFCFFILNLSTEKHSRIFLLILPNM